MAVIKRTVSTHGFEQGFIEALYDAFLEIDGITMNPPKEDIPNFFKTTGTKYTFTLTYKGIQIIFSRVSNIEVSDASSLNISVANTNLKTQILSWSAGGNYTNERTRTLKFVFVISDSAFEAIFSSYNSDGYFEKRTSHTSPYRVHYYLFIPISENDINNYLYMGDVDTITKLSSKTFYKMGEDNPYTIAQNFSYPVPDNGIQMRDSSTLLLDSNRVMDIKGLLNCTIVPVNTKLTIGNKEYFSIGTDVIVEI